MSKILKSTTLGNVKNGGIFKALGKEFVKLDGQIQPRKQSNPVCIRRWPDVLHDKER